MDFGEYLTKSDVPENSKVYWNESSVILVKVDEMYNILKTLLATGNWSRDEGGIRLSKFFAGAFTTPLLYYGSRLYLLVTISYYFFIKFRLSM